MGAPPKGSRCGPSCMGSAAAQLCRPTNRPRALIAALPGTSRAPRPARIAVIHCRRLSRHMPHPAIHRGNRQARPRATVRQITLPRPIPSSPHTRALRPDIPASQDTRRTAHPDTRSNPAPTDRTRLMARMRRRGNRPPPPGRRSSSLAGPSRCRWRCHPPSCNTRSGSPGARAVWESASWLRSCCWSCSSQSSRRWHRARPPAPPRR